MRWSRREPGSHVYAAATTRDQARIVFGEAERMVDASPALRARVTRTVNNLAVLPRLHGSDRSRPMPRRWTVSTCIRAVDEVHEHPNAEIIQKLNTATGARRQPLIFEITTAGHDASRVLAAPRILGQGAGRQRPDRGRGFLVRLHRHHRCRRRLDQPRGLDQGQSSSRHRQGGGPETARSRKPAKCRRSRTPFGAAPERVDRTGTR